VLLLSDTHVGAVVKPEQTCGYGKYDFLTFLRRLKRLEDSVVSILQDHTTTPVSELVIPILGDCLDGALTHGSEAGQVNTLFSQFYAAGHALSQFIRNLSAVVPAIRIYCVVGNHPRLPSQHKMPTKNRFSNLDGFLMAYVQALLRDVPKVSFTLNRQPFTEFKVQGYTFLASHGDHMRGGDKALGIPAHALGRSVSFNSQIRLKTEQAGINYYVLGHFHRPMQIPHALGSILVNGAFVGVDEFGLTESFTPCPPVQKFFLMHPTFGMSATYDLNLAFAKTDGTPYEIPGEFPMQ
jgi:UDP-2,3-diacylglucosamine pyrophosphatase LpxH